MTPSAMRRLMLITWRDASKNSDWTPCDDAKIDHPSGLIRTAGWVVAEDDVFLLVASSLGDGQVCLQMQIPKSTIISRKRLKE